MNNPYAPPQHAYSRDTTWLLCSLPVVALGALVGVCHGFSAGAFVVRMLLVMGGK